MPERPVVYIKRQYGRPVDKPRKPYRSGSRCRNRVFRARLLSTKGPVLPGREKPFIIVVSRNGLNKSCSVKTDPPFRKGNLHKLIRVMRMLRGAKGCPWDRRQDHYSLRPYLVEEAYEVIDAIDSGDSESLRDELGDLLLQVVFHAQIADENNLFDMGDVIDGIVKKLIRRHPHVFGGVLVKGAAGVKKRWEEIKKEEKEAKGQADLSLTVDSKLPALLKARKVQEKASLVGFDWHSIEGPFDKLKEELNELFHAYQSGLKERIEEELGDLLFAAVNVSRFMKVDPELALSRAVKKFQLRFRFIEDKARELGMDISNEIPDLNEMDVWWNEAKKKDKEKKN